MSGPMTRRRGTGVGLRSADDHGFSLIELLIGIVLMGVVGSIMLTGVVRSLGVTSEATTRVDALTALQQAVERSSRNIRAADPITAASATALTVTVYDDVTRRRITYAHTGAQVTETTELFPNHITVTPTSTTTRALIQELDQQGNPVFRYFRADGTAWTTGPVGEIARVEIHLRRAVDRGAPIQLTSSAFVRNTLP
jgi:prepilin-type N-terminal cleavage/methylation domain-containing protein